MILGKVKKSVLKLKLSTIETMGVMSYTPTMSYIRNLRVASATAISTVLTTVDIKTDTMLDMAGKVLQLLKKKLRRKYQIIVWFS